MVGGMVQSGGGGERMAPVSDCIVLHCDGNDWRDGYCWIHHQAWVRYLANLPDDSEPEQFPVVLGRYTYEVQWHVTGELWVDMGAKGVDFVQVNVTVYACSRAEALRKAKRRATTRPRARWDFDTVECVVVCVAA